MLNGLHHDCNDDVEEWGTDAIELIKYISSYLWTALRLIVTTSIVIFRIILTTFHTSRIIKVPKHTYKSNLKKNLVDFPMFNYISRKAYIHLFSYNFFFSFFSSE